ncbi:MAG: autotransporter outer membrane beta-barrel domain-containing protein, partial [Neisseriaceae bacterium]|nr:autotransporter outer membrane beta-barrel domain-containing protein [Neisseriaceae bacterium]
KEYEEKSKRGTAMQFDALKVNQNYISLGLQYHLIRDDISFQADISAQHDFSDKEKDISSGLKSAPRNFIRTVEINDKNWYLAQLNLNKEFNQGLQLNIGSGIQYSKKSKQKFNLSLGLKKHF